MVRKKLSTMNEITTSLSDRTFTYGKEIIWATFYTSFVVDQNSVILSLIKTTINDSVLMLLLFVQSQILQRRQEIMAACLLLI